MLTNFFQFGPIPLSAMTGTYDFRLVALSYLVAVFASYIALDLTGRLRDINNTSVSRTMWLCCGAIAMGIGIWSMHFIGMLAFKMPSMSMSYDPFWTGFSMVVAILASGFALFLLKANIINWIHLALGGIILGLAIATMHYTGMQAMKINVDIHYIPSLFIASIIIAIIASEAALWLALKSNQAIMSLRFRLKFMSAFIMGAAICGMHYTGMAAAVFTHAQPMTVNTPSLNPEILSISIAIATFLILGIAVLASTYKEAKNQQLLAMARQAGMAEVAASVLHNVGNVLNSINVSANMVAETIEKSKISELNRLSHLIAEHKADLSHFITQDERGIALPNYIESLSQYWIKERTKLKDETNILLRNIEHIKSIIAMQQNLSKVININQIVDINKMAEEALLITGIESNHPDIKIIKHYKSLKPVIIDKIKLLQILVNLLHNAKDSLVQSTTSTKELTLTTDLCPQGRFTISISDNGSGISPNNLVKIFSYGFTTKESGHGFGLHSAILAAKEMGGTITAKSDGLQKGAIFTLELPYTTPKQ